MTPKTSFLVGAPALTFYHPNGKGTGSALKIQMRTADANIPGCLAITLSNQRHAAKPGTFATFEWENSVTVTVDMVEIGHIIEVLSGNAESIDDGKGFFAHDKTANVILRFTHRIEPCPGYRLDMYRKCKDTEKEDTFGITLTPTEALTLRLALEGAMSRIAWG